MKEPICFILAEQGYRDEGFVIQSVSEFFCSVIFSAIIKHSSTAELLEIL